MDSMRIIIDCDPGQDDAINLFLAFASPERFDVLGVTTVAGNAPVSLSSRNARLLCELVGREDVAVFQGCENPILVPPLHANHVHGESGIDGLIIREPKMPLRSQHAVNFIVDTCLEHRDQPITVVATGPLTNLATALIMQPQIKRGIEQIVHMGGAMREGGNITPSAEFNMRVDPHAADIVLRCGLPIVAMGLDVTHQALVTQERLRCIVALSNPVAQAAHDMLSFFNRYDSNKYGTDGAPLHDACTIAYLLQPDLFQLKLCNVSVECGSLLTRGHTAVDFWHVGEGPRNVNWAYGVEADALFDLIFDRLSFFSKSIGTS
jgi:purine nucleosidase